MISIAFPNCKSATVMNRRVNAWVFGWFVKGLFNPPGGCDPRVESHCQQCLHSWVPWVFWNSFWGESSLRNNELRLPQVVSSFLDNAYFEEDAKNCAVYKATKHCCPRTVPPNTSGYAEFQEIPALYCMYVCIWMIRSTFSNEGSQRFIISALEPWATLPTTCLMNLATLA